MNNRENIVQFYLPAGSYWIGDLQFALYNYIWEDFFEHQHNKKDGIYHYNNNYFAIHQTYFIEDSFLASLQESYDLYQYSFESISSSFGITSIELIDLSKDTLDKGFYLSSKYQICFQYDFNYGIFRIETNDFWMYIFTGIDNTYSIQAKDFPIYTKNFMDKLIDEKFSEKLNEFHKFIQHCEYQPELIKQFRTTFQKYFL